MTERAPRAATAGSAAGACKAPDLASSKRAILPPTARSRAALGLTAGAAVGRLELQVCRQCGAVQYPPREACHRCLSSRLDWKVQEGRGELLSETTLLHTHHEFFRRRLPIRLGLVRLDSGPTAVVYLHESVLCAPARVRIAAHLDRAGLATLVALAEDSGGHEPLLRMRGAAMTNSRHLREMVCDPRGRKVLVTSTESAVGTALVRALLAAGADTVWAGYRLSSGAPQDAILQDLVAGSKQVILVQLDVTSEQSVREAAAAAGSEVDIMINTAECRGTAHAEMDSNYFGLLRLAHAFGPIMRARAAAADSELGPCAWVNLLSICALSSAPGLNTFSASKAAAHSLSQSLRADLLPAGIRVVNVFPGLVDEEWARELPPPKLAPETLARAIVEALLDGVEDVYPGEVAQDWFNRWRDNPKTLERELAAERSAE